MTFFVHMRVGSLEVLAALALFLFVASRIRAAGGDELRIPVEFRIRRGTLDRPFRGRAPLLIGRSRSADIVLDDARASRLHARIMEAQGALFVQDLGSSNGTFVNGEAVREMLELRAGDELQIGATTLTLVGSAA